METATQVTLVIYAIFAATTCAVMIGKPRTASKASNLGFAVFVYGMIGSAIVIWWPTPDIWSLIGKSTVLATFAVSLAANVIILKSSKPRGKTFTAREGLSSMILPAVWLACALFLWP